MNCSMPIDSTARFLWKDGEGAMRMGTGQAHDIRRHGVFIATNSAPSPGAEVQVIVEVPLPEAGGHMARLMGKGVAVGVEDDGRKPAGFAAKVLFQSDWAGLLVSHDDPVFALSHLPEVAAAAPWTGQVSTNCPTEAVA